MTFKRTIDRELAYKLYIEDDLEVKEVAKILGCTTKGLKSLIHRERFIKKPRIDIGRDLLYELYITQNLSRQEVAKELNINEFTLKKKLHKYKIKKSIEGHIENIRKTCMEKYGLPNGGWAPDTQKKIKRTNLERYGSESYLQCDDYKKKNKETLERLGVTNVFQLEDVKKKSKETMVKKYGVEHNTQNKEIAKQIGEKIKHSWENKTDEQKREIVDKVRSKLFLYWENMSKEDKNKFINKINATKRKNGTFNTSKPEQKIKELLEERFPDTKCQYSSKSYPYLCDFYIPCLDLYIEFQGLWSHGKHPFDPENKKDLQKLSVWKEKSNTSKFYKNAIETWTIRDPLKRKTAKENNLKWMEFFDFNAFVQWFMRF